LDGRIISSVVGIEKPVTIGPSPGSGFTVQTFGGGASSGGKLTISGADSNRSPFGDTVFRERKVWRTSLFGSDRASRQSSAKR